MRFWRYIFYFILCAGMAEASPSSLTYQGRIVKADGTPLEYSNVSFIFQITDPTGSCVIYQEQVTGYSMTNSKGIFDTPIGNGTVSWPMTGTFTVLDAFKNSNSFTCGDCAGYSCSASSGSPYVAAVDDSRKLRVHFYDGQGWKTISPDNVIRSVPFAAYSLSAQKLGTKTANDFILKNTLPTLACSSNQVLSFNGTNFECVTDQGGSGVISSVVGSGPITATGTGNITIGAVVGTGANTLAAGDDARFSDARIPTGNAGGSLSGTYPNPVLANNSVSASNIIDGAVGVTKLAAGAASGQVLRYSGSIWQATKLNYADLVNANNVSPWPGTCGAGEYITWVSITDGFACTALSSSAVIAALGYTPANANGAWTADGSGNIYRAAGNVGIGTTSPSFPLDIRINDASNYLVLTNSTSTAARTPAIVARNYANGTSGYPFLTVQNHGGTLASPSSLGANAIVGKYQFQAGLASTVIPVASIEAETGPNFSTSDYETSLHFSTADGTGIYKRMTVAPNGDIGIGTIDPISKFHVFNDVNANTSMWVSNPNVGTVALAEVGASNGSAGVSLSMAGSSLTTNGSFVANWGMLRSSASASGLKLAVGNSSAPITFEIGTSEKMRLTDSGNVGVGTTSPGLTTSVGSTVLTVQGASGSGRVEVSSSVTDADGITLGQFQISDSNNPSSVDKRIATISAQTSGSTANNRGGKLFFATRADNGIGAVTRMVIDNSGNIGIGTTNPSAKLHVHGDADMATAFYSRGNIHLTPETNTTSQTAITFAGKRNSDGWLPTFAAIAAKKTMDSATNIAGELNFYTGQTDSFHTTGPRMVIDKDGKVGIGTAAPSSSLYVLSAAGGPAIRTESSNSASYGGIRVYNNSGKMLDLSVMGTTYSGTEGPDVGRIYSDATNGLRISANSAPITFFPMNGGSEAMRVSGAGNIGIKTTNPSYALHVVGDTYTSGYFRSPNGTIQTSDERFKTNIEPIRTALEKILNVRGVTYDWRRQEFPEQAFSDQHQMGVIAQEVEAEFPEAVITDKDGYKAVNYSSLVAPLIEAVRSLYQHLLDVADRQTLQARRIASLEFHDTEKEKEITQLKQENAIKTQELEAIKKYLCIKDPQAPFCR